MERFLLLVGAIVAMSSVATALYEKKDAVVVLTEDNFDKHVKNSDGVWIIEFYAPWCGHCKSLAPEYKKAAKALSGIVGVGAVDCDVHKTLCGQFGVRGFPTIKVFGNDKSKPQDYQGARDAAGIAQEAAKTAQKIVAERLGGKWQGSSSGGSGGGSNGGSGGGSDAVVELTESNFKKLVLDSDEPWLIEFFAPWCGHCKNLEPHWKKAAKELKGKFKLGAVDATIHQSLGQQYEVQGYPTIKYFPAGKKSKAEEYNGGRTADDIVAWAGERAEVNMPPPELVQITNDAVMKEHCESKSLCVIAFLPHILDCQSSCRNKYLATLKKMGDTFKKQGWGWLWSEGAAQMDLEESLGVGGFGYPAMAVVSHKKMKFSRLTGSFGHDGIREYLRDLSYGKGRTDTVKGAKLPKISKLEGWDGKDGELPVEEEYDLSDVDLDDKDEL